MQRLYPFLFVFLWSTGFIGAKFGLPYAEPLSFLLTRYGLVIGLMLAIALATRAPWPRQPSQWLHIGVSGVLVSVRGAHAHAHTSSITSGFIRAIGITARTIPWTGGIGASGWCESPSRAGRAP